jgi:hypothetical protein
MRPECGQDPNARRPTPQLTGPDARPSTSHQATAAITIPDPGRIRRTPCPPGGFGLARCTSARCPTSTSNNPPSPSSSATHHSPDPIPSRSPRPACCLPGSASLRSSKPNGEGSPTARPSAEKRAEREKIWRSIALTSSITPPPRLGLEHPTHDAIDFIEGRTAVTPMALHETVIGDLNRRMLMRYC